MTTTIVAIASPPGAGERSVLRLSGPETRALVARVFVPDGEAPLLAARGAQRGRLDDGRGAQPALLFLMPGPASYTREDVAELHLPGSPPLAAAALRRLLALGAETAGPGEFTRRAFLHGRLDLSRAEGVLALIEARNDDERRAASRLFGGGLARRVEGLRERLEELRALAEASLDFDESDTGHVPTKEIEALAAGAAAALDQALAWEVGRQAPSALPRVLLYGAPNAGKSSLWNALVPSGDALVASLAGTTRDVREGLWTVEGRPCLLIDAPGIDKAARGADAAAQELAQRELEAADLILWVQDAKTLTLRSRAARLSPETEARLRRETEAAQLFGEAEAPRPRWEEEAAPPPGGAETAKLRLRAAAASIDREFEPIAERPRLLLWNKTEDDLAWLSFLEASGRTGSALAVSALNGKGLDALESRVAALLGTGGGLGRELFERHRGALGAAREALEEGRTALAGGAPLDLVAEAFRAATGELDRILGRTRPDDLLDRIFARFCIGK